MFFNVKLMLIASCVGSALGQKVFDGGAAQISNSPQERSNKDNIPDPDKEICPTEEGGRGLRALQASPGWKGREYCSISEPGDVVNFRVVCTGASYLDFQIADCCINGDHWQLKGKAWDVAPQTAVTTSPGRPSQYGVPARVYNYGGTPNAPKRLDALIECSYLHGVNVFGAGSFVALVSDGTDCQVTKTAVSARIDRSP